MFKKFLAKKGLKPEDLASKTESELAELNAEFLEDCIKNLDTAISSKAPESEIEAIKKSITDIPKYDDKALKDEVISLSAQVRALKEAPIVPVSAPRTMKAALADALNTPEVTAAFKSVKENDGNYGKPIKMEVNKAAVDITTANTIGAGDTQYTLTENTNIISPIRKRVEKYLAAVSVGSISSPRALWIEETDEQGNVIFIAEGAAKTKLSVKYVEQTATVRKVAVYAKVTTEMMADLPQLISYIQNNLMKRLSLATEDALLNGLGTGETLTGAFAYASAYTGDSLAGTVVLPNEFDVLRGLALQVEVANGIANAVFIHPATWARMQTIKDLEGRPLWMQYVIPGSGDVVFAGMKIVTTTAVADDKFIGGDMSVLNVLFRENLSITIGLDGNDFTENKKTILVEQRLVQFVSANDVQVIVDGDFSVAIEALLKATI